MTAQTVANDIRVNRDAVELLLICFQITRTQIAEASGLPRFTVTKVLRNRDDVGPEKKMAVLRAIAALTGRDPEALVMGRLAA